jgi:hypothetical protein
MSDALERLKNRTRPTVNSRDASLTSAPPSDPTPPNNSASLPLGASTHLDIPTSRYPDLQNSTTSEAVDDRLPDNKGAKTKKSSSPRATGSKRILDNVESRNKETKTSRYLDIQSLRAEDVEVSSILDAKASSNLDADLVLSTKQSTLRLEQGVSDRLQNLCRTQGLCREVLIEALFEYSESHPDALNTIIAQAQVKQEQRQQVANQRRAQSMMQRFGTP